MTLECGGRGCESECICQRIPHDMQRPDASAHNKHTYFAHSTIVQAFYFSISSEEHYFNLMVCTHCLMQGDMPLLAGLSCFSPWLGTFARMFRSSAIWPATAVCRCVTATFLSSAVPKRAVQTRRTTNAASGAATFDVAGAME